MAVAQSVLSRGSLHAINDVIGCRLLVYIAPCPAKKDAFVRSALAGDRRAAQKMHTEKVRGEWSNAKKD